MNGQISKNVKIAPGKKIVFQLAEMRAYFQWCSATLEVWILGLKIWNHITSFLLPNWIQYIGVTKHIKTQLDLIVKQINAMLNFKYSWLQLLILYCKR